MSVRNRIIGLFAIASVAGWAIGMGLHKLTSRPSAPIAVNIAMPAPVIPPMISRPFIPPPPEPAGVPIAEKPTENSAPPTAPSEIITTKVAQPKAAPQANAPAQSNPGPVAPEARTALSFVGTDPVANAVWVSAINDPNVPPDERKDLIEDLNEDGFSDPHNITVNDLPLVASRIRLIETLAPSSMDDTNAAAFKEAYKDLTNMLGNPNPK